MPNFYGSRCSKIFYKIGVCEGFAKFTEKMAVPESLFYEVGSFKRFIQKLLKTSYLMARKKLTVCENFESFAYFVKDISDKNILKQKSKKSKIPSNRHVTHFLDFQSDHLERSSKTD